MNAPSFINPDKNIPHKQRLGRCYELAGNFAFNNPSVVLVHGSIQGPGAPRIPHAWVSYREELFWEPTLNKFWDKATFYAFHNAIAYRRYDHESLVRLMVSSENWGPWAHQPIDQIDTMPEATPSIN